MSVSRGAAGRRLDPPTRLLFRAQLAREAFGVRRRGTAVLTLQPTADDLAAAGLNAMDPRSWAAVVDSARGSTARRLQDQAVRALLDG